MAHGHTKKHDHCDHCLHDCGPCDAAYCCNCSKEWRNCHAFHGWYNPWPYRPYGQTGTLYGGSLGTTTTTTARADTHAHAHSN